MTFSDSTAELSAIYERYEDGYRLLRAEHSNTGSMLTALFTGRSKISEDPMHGNFYREVEEFFLKQSQRLEGQPQEQADRVTKELMEFMLSYRAGQDPNNIMYAACEPHIACLLPYCSSDALRDMAAMYTKGLPRSRMYPNQRKLLEKLK